SYNELQSKRLNMLETFKELFSSTISTTAQRVKNPALGAFALSWCAFNWKSLLYLLFSDGDILNKIEFITTNSTWKTVAGYPCVSVIVICGFLPWINNVISRWQARPLDNNDSIENYRKAKQILRATRLQRLQAKQDVTYDKVKTGAEKDIQAMKEQIIESKDRMGILTSELKDKEEKLRNESLLAGELKLKLEQSTNVIGQLKESLEKMNNAYNSLSEQFNLYKKNHPEELQTLGSGGLLSGLTSLTPEMIREYIANQESEKSKLNKQILNRNTQGIFTPKE
ncbi:hypothetical protein, partial [Enterobacter ludwigii]|uniref:hypothetical protein n=2 Tax=Enterobacter ludwigii TaxID=299767 RepID=UPI002FD63D7A